MSTTVDSGVKEAVRERYAKVAQSDGASPCCSTSCCESSQRPVSTMVGYSREELAALPSGADLGLGCGNPVALASLKKEETVLDLGSGAGIDCFLAANRVGPTGKVIGVDMTPEMIEKARANAKKGGYTNVEFRQGEIESLPVDDDSVDAIISNCVINLSTDKPRTFAEAYRVLRPGGRLMVSDLVLLRELPEAARRSVSLYAGCIAGALMKDEYLAAIRGAGFRDVRVERLDVYPVDALASDPNLQSLIEDLNLTPEELIALAKDTVASLKVSARK